MEVLQDPQGPKLLVRCERTRNRKSENEYLWEKVTRQPASGIHVVRIPRKGCRLAREARLEVRHAQVEINAPSGKAYPPVSRLVSGLVGTPVWVIVSFREGG